MAAEVASAPTPMELEATGETNEETTAAPLVEEAKPKSKDQKHVYSPELLKMYYARLFPFDMMYDWFAYDPLKKHPKTFRQREFSFTIEPMPGQEIYIRYLSYSSAQQFKDDVAKRQPHKIDIGAVFSCAPKDKSTAATPFTPQQRELVFDIDLTDYDDIRKCGCEGAAICPKCWTLMNMACKVLDEGLREDFGFEKVAWFYSGRRGVHAWVCDESARMLSNDARSAVANYFEISLSKKKSEGLPLPLHPMLARSFKVLEPYFIEHVLPESGQSLLSCATHWEPLLDTLPETARDTVGENLKQQWKKPSNRSTPAEKWLEINEHLQILFGFGIDEDGEKRAPSKKAKSLSTEMKARIETWAVETVFKHTYPRLDINVSKMQNHLLKSPFCVHPKTGRVCVPIQVKTIEDFDPFAVPTLPQLMTELDEYHNQHEDADKVKDWQKTSLKQYFEPFQKEFLEPMMKELRQKAREEAEEKAAVIGDF